MFRTLAPVAVLGFAALALAGSLAPLKFDMKDPKGVSGMSIKIDSPLEPVHGHANGVTGDITFDPANPAAAKGKIVVEAASTFLGSKDLTEAMHQDWAMDVKKFKTIEFAIDKVSNVKSTGKGVWTATVNGKFSFHGVTKPMTVQATATHLPDRIQTRGGMEGVKGDLLTIRCKFAFNRLDYKVAPDLNTALIGNKIEIDLSLVGVSPK